MQIYIYIYYIAYSNIQVGQRGSAEERQIRILGGRSRARARVEARTCDTQLTNNPSTHQQSANIIVSPVFLAPFI